MSLTQNIIFCQIYPSHGSIWCTRLFAYDLVSHITWCASRSLHAHSAPGPPMSDTRYRVHLSCSSRFGVTAACGIHHLRPCSRYNYSTWYRLLAPSQVTILPASHFNCCGSHHLGVLPTGMKSTPAVPARWGSFRASYETRLDLYSGCDNARCCQGVIALVDV